MREDHRFEIERAFDLLPHVVGASWAVVWFRLNDIKRPTREEYRNKVIEYFEMLIPIFESYPDNANFTDMKKFIQCRKEDISSK